MTSFSIDKNSHLFNILESRCFGFVEFNEFVDARQIINQQPHYIDGKVVECKLAVPKDPIKDDKKRKKKK